MEQLLAGERSVVRKCSTSILMTRERCESIQLTLVKTYDDAQMIAGLIVTNTTADSHMGDQVWGQAETHLLQALLMHAAGMRAAIDKPSVKGDGANLGAIRRLLRKGPTGMEAEFAVTRSAIANQNMRPS
jgi:hypothetical protein